FAYTGPGPLTERVNGYYKEFEENGVPVTPAINPNILAIGGDLSMMVAKTDDQALERLGQGGGFFSFGIMHYYMTGVHTPGHAGPSRRCHHSTSTTPSAVCRPGVAVSSLPVRFPRRWPRSTRAGYRRRSG